MKIRKGSLSYWVLTALEKAAEKGVVEMFSYSAQIRELRRSAGLTSTLNQAALARTLSRLKNNGLIEYQKNQEGTAYLKLTAVGSDLVVLNEKWDGKYRVVIWDIPERNKRIRNLLRRRLKEWGFTSVQRSVWISKKNVTRQFRKLIEELGIEKWVVVFETEDRVFETIIERSLS